MSPLIPALAILNAAKGNASISHAQFIVLSALLHVLYSPHPILAIYVTIATAVPATGRLFTHDAPLYGWVRGLLAVIPAFLVTHDPRYLVLLGLGILYKACLKIDIKNGVRYAEFATGWILGCLCQMR